MHHRKSSIGFPAHKRVSNYDKVGSVANFGASTELQNALPLECYNVIQF